MHVTSECCASRSQPPAPAFPPYPTRRTPPAVPHPSYPTRRTPPAGPHLPCPTRRTSPVPVLQPPCNTPPPPCISSFRSHGILMMLLSCCFTRSANKRSSDISVKQNIKGIWRILSPALLPH